MNFYGQSEINTQQTILLQILSKDRVGLVHEITATISSLNVSIKYLNAKVFKNKKQGKRSLLEVKICIDEDDLQILFRKLRKIKGVMNLNLID